MRRFVVAVVCLWFACAGVPQSRANRDGTSVDSQITAQAPADDLVAKVSAVARRGSTVAPAILNVEKTNDGFVAVIVFAANDDGSVAVAGNLDGRIARTTDGGRTWYWIQRGAADPMATRFSAAAYVAATKRFLLAEESGRLLVSEDKGSTWRPSKIHLGRQIKRLVSSSTGTILAIATDGAVLRFSGNDDVGQRVRESSQTAFIDACFIPGTRIAIAIDGSGALLRSVDDGATWAEHLIDYTYRLREILCNEQAIVAGGVFNIIAGAGPRADYTLPIPHPREVERWWPGIVVRSGDSGAHWSVAARTNFPITEFAYDVTQRRYLAVGESGSLVSTDADAKVWKVLSTPGTPRFVDVAMYGADGAAIALGQDGELYDTKDSGAHWARIDGGPPNAKAVIALKNVIVAYEYGLSLITESAASVPRITGIRSTRQIGSELVIDVELDDPDDRCGENCIEVAGWSDADYARRSKLAPRVIGAESVSRPSGSTIRVAFDPVAILSANQNSNVHLYFTLEGAGFKLRYPASDGAYAIAYQPNWNAIVAIAVFGGLALLIGLVFVLRPVWIVFLACRAEKFADAMPIPIVQSAIKTVAALVLWPLLYRRRVLAAWAIQQRGRFLRRLRLDAPQSYDYVPLPFEIRGGASAPATMSAGITGDDLRRAIAGTHPVIVISGFGGTGKSTLANRIAELAASDGLLACPALPVWFSADAAMPAQIPERVREIADTPSLPAAFIEHLARGGFLLLVADGVSEAPQASRTMWEEFAKRGHVVVLTTRRNDTLAGRDYTYFNTHNLDAHNAAALLTGIVTSLLRTRGDVGAVLGIQAAMMAAFARMVGGDPLVSPLLVRLFARNYLGRAVDAFESGDSTQPLPPIDVAPSATQVYFDYLAELHARKRSGNAAFDGEALLFDACKALAIRELAGDYLPKALRHDDGVGALKQALGIDDNVASQLLERLIDDGILRTYSLEGHVMWGFEFDPVAEYVAARALIERDVRKMRKTLVGLAAQADPPQGFIDAAQAILRDQDKRPHRENRHIGR